jgi:hypothetical protein
MIGLIGAARILLSGGPIGNSEPHILFQELCVTREAGVSIKSLLEFV